MDILRKHGMELTGYVFRPRVGFDSISSDPHHAMVRLQVYFYIPFSKLIIYMSRQARHFSSASGIIYSTSKLTPDSTAPTPSDGEAVNGSQWCADGRSAAFATGEDGRPHLTTQALCLNTCSHGWTTPSSVERISSTLTGHRLILALIAVVLA